MNHPFNTAGPPGTPPVTPSPLGGDFLLTTPAASYIGVRPQTLRAWRLKGRGPAYTRLGDGPYARAAYRKSDLDAWLAARKFRSTAEENTRGRT